MMQFSAIPLLPLLQYETIPFYHVYLVDYAAPETREVGEQAILRELEQLKDDSRKKKVLQNLELIKTTPRRDMFF